MEKKHIYLGLGLLAVTGLGIYLYRRNKNSETKSNAIGRRTGTSATPLSRENKILMDGTPVTVIGLPPKPTNLWVSSGDPEKCTWYDKDGNATTVYNSPCTLAQANMKGGGSPK